MPLIRRIKVVVKRRSGVLTLLFGSSDNEDLTTKIFSGAKKKGQPHLSNRPCGEKGRATNLFTASGYSPK